MNTFTDEELSAFADSELDCVTAARIREALLDDPGLTERVHQHVNATAMLRAAYVSLPISVPAGAARLIQGAGAPTPFWRGQDWPPQRAPRAVRGHPAIAIAATIALVVGVTAGYFGARLGGSDPAIVASPATLAADAASPIARLRNVTLEQQVSGTDRSWTDPASGEVVVVKPIRTYAVKDAGFCREYQQIMTDPRGTTTTLYGLACRTSEGRWDIRDAGAGRTPTDVY